MFLGTRGYMDEIPVHDIKRFEKELLEFVEVKHKDIFDVIKKEKDISQQTEEKLKKAAEEFLSTFKKSS
jgi:F-type H+-transporting ATPase subunit alpha